MQVECTLESHKLRNRRATRPDAFQLGTEIALELVCPATTTVLKRTCSPEGALTMARACLKKVRPQARKIAVKWLLPAVTLGLEPIRHRHLCEMQPCRVRQSYASKA